MKTTLAHLHLYLKAGWPITIPCLIAGFFLVVLPGNIVPSQFEQSSIPLLGLLLFIVLCVGLAFRFAPSDEYTLSVGTPPARRLRLLLMAYAFHIGLVWLILALVIWLRLRSSAQNLFLNPFYPAAAFIDDPAPFLWLRYLACFAVCCIEANLRFAAHYPRPQNYILSGLGFISSVAFNFTLKYVGDESLWSFLGFLMLLMGALFATRLVNIFFIWPTIQVAGHFSAHRPLIVRIGDAILLTGWPLLFFVLFIQDGIQVGQFQVGQTLFLVCSWVILVIAGLGIVAAGLYAARNCTIRSAIVLGISLALIFFPGRWLRTAVIDFTSVNPPKDRITFITHTPQASFVLNGVTFKPTSSYKESSLRDPYYMATITHEQFSPVIRGLKLGSKEYSQPDPSAFPGIATSHTFENHKTKEVHQIGLAIGADPVYLSENANSMSSGFTFDSNARFPVNASPFELYRRQQPLIAWMILHPVAPQSAPLLQHMQIRDNYLALLERIPPEAQKTYRDQLRRDTYPAGFFAGADDFQQLLAIVQKLKDHPVTDLETPAIKEISPKLSLDQVARLIRASIRQPATIYHQTSVIRAMRSPALDMIFTTWLDHQNPDPATLRNIQTTLAPLLIASSNYRSLAKLSGPIADQFFRRAANQFGNPTSHQRSGKNIYDLASFPHTLGASMSGPEGVLFRRNFAEPIVALLTWYRRETDGIHFGQASALNDWFSDAMGPIPEPGETNPVRRDYWNWFLANIRPERSNPMVMADSRLNELANVMLETRLQPYLDILASPEYRFVPFKDEPKQQQLISFVEQLVSHIDIWQPTHGKPDKRELFHQIIQAVLKDPAQYGLPANLVPTEESRQHIDGYFLSVQERLSPQSIQSKQLTTLINTNKLSPAAKIQKLTLAIEVGSLTYLSTKLLATQPNPTFRQYAPDLIVRWPTPENLALLATLAADTDSSVAERAKAAQRFIDNLKALPLNQVPGLYTPEAIRFFDLTRVEK